MKNFKLEWDKEDFKNAYKAIERHFKGQIMLNHKGEAIKFPSSYNAEDEEILGLAYTSSSSYAGLWVCGVTIQHNTFENHHYIGFAIDDQNNVVAVLWDNEEKEILLNISK